MNDIEQILRINAYIQRGIGKLTFGGKQIMCVALDHSCTFEGPTLDEVTLDDAQLAEVYRQTFFTPPKEERERQAIQEVWRVNTPHHLMAYGIDALLREKDVYLTRDKIETIMAELVSENKNRSEEQA